MPSYRYLRDIDPNDLKPEEPKELSGKEKRKNWWHYHKVWVIVGVLVFGIVGFTVYDVVTQVHPDLTVTVLSPYTLPEQLTDKLQTGLEQWVDDLNGDGQVRVQVNMLTIAIDEDAGGTDPNTQMANVVKLSGDLQTGDTMLFMMDSTAAELYQAGYGIFGLADGQIAPEDATAAELGVAFGQLPGLADMDLMLDGSDGSTLDASEYMSSFLLGVRAYYGTALDGKSEHLESWEYTQQLLQRLAEG